METNLSDTRDTSEAWHEPATETELLKTQKRHSRNSVLKMESFFKSLYQKEEHEILV